MDPAAIESLLKEVREGQTGVADALERLRHLPFEDLGFAKLDHHRALRTGMPEVIFAAGKTSAQVAAIFARMAKAGGNVLATRASRRCLRRSSVWSRGPSSTRLPAPLRSLRMLLFSRQGNHCRGMRRDQRSAGGRRSGSDCAADGQRGSN